MTPAHIRNDGHNYHPTHRLGAVRASFRRDHRRGPAHRSRARRAVRLRARADLARRAASAWPAPSTTSSSSGPRPGAAAARWPRSRAPRSARWPASPPPSRSSSSSSSRWPASASPSSTRSQESAWGTFTIGVVDSARAVHGPLHVPVPARAGSPRRRSSACIGLLLAVILGQAARGVVVRPLVPPARANSSSSRWLRYGFIASVLPVWLLLCPRDYLSSFMKIGTIAFLVVGVIDRQPRAEDAGVQPVHRRRRPDHPGTALPVRLHHDRVRRDLRIPRADRVGHDAEDDRPRVGHPPDRLRRDADRRAGRHRVAHRRDGDVPRRLLRHQHAAGGLRQPRHSDRQSARRSRRRSAKR